MRSTLVAFVVVAALAGDGGDAVSDPARHALSPVPDDVVEACHAAQADASFTVLCPARLPRASIGHPTQPPPPLTARVLRDRGVVVGVEMGYGAPYPGVRAKNDPGRFLHLAVLRGDVEVARPPRGSAPLGTVPFGEITGSLFAAPSSSSSRWGGYHAHHLVFRWRRGGAPYTASLHSWGRGDATPLLGAVVESLVPADTMAPPTARERPAGMSQIDLGGDLSALDATDDALWVAEYYAGLHQLDPERGARVGRPIDVTRFPDDLATSDDSVWVVGGTTGKLLQRVDVGARDVVATVTMEDRASAVAVGDRYVWVASYDGRSITRVDPATNRVTGEPIRVQGGIADLAAFDEAVWATDFDRGAVVRLDEATGDVVAEVRVGGRPSGVAAAAGAVWVTDWERDEVVRIDPALYEVAARVPVGPAPSGVAARADAAWVADYWDGTVTRVDARTGEATTTGWGLAQPRDVVARSGRMFALGSDGSIAVLPVAAPSPRAGDGTGSGLEASVVVWLAALAAAACAAAWALRKRRVP